LLIGLPRRIFYPKSLLETLLKSITTNVGTK